MNNQQPDKRPYEDLLKNLFHEQATEIIPLLLPDYHVEEVLDIEMPDLISTPIERSPSSLEEGIIGLVIPDAKVVQAYRTEWIEHSGTFERTYRVTNSETDKPAFLVVEVQTEREDGHLPSRLLANFASIDRHVRENIVQVDEGEDNSEEQVEDVEDGQEDLVEDAEEKPKGTIMNVGYYVYPAALCPFPNGVPAPIRNEFMGQVMLAFNFKVIDLWERDAREFLNRQASSLYFLLPVMKNADATLLELAIAQLAQRFQGDQSELARHLTGLSLMLQRSETLADDEKLTAQKLLQPFAHLLDETLI